MEQHTGNIEIENNISAHRFDALVDGHLAFVQYRYSDGGDIVLVHTEVPGELAGRGIGGKLARAALEYARARQLSVVVTCPFITNYINKHPEYQPLISPRSG